MHMHGAGHLEGRAEARHIASTAVGSGRPKQSTVRTSAGAGSTLMATSVITASVPQEPARRAARS